MSTIPDRTPLLILASASPRRGELVQLLGFRWLVRPADVDEESVQDPVPAVNVVRTASLKAREVAKLAPPNSIVLAADTIVVCDGVMLNKPKSAQHAREMLLELRGRVHQVYTGIVLVETNSGRVVEDIATVDVPMRNYSRSEINTYIATGDPLDKAGAYAIQHQQFNPVAGLEGCYAAVVGLPLCHLARALRRLGVRLTTDIAGACQKHHHYSCPIFEQILNG